MCPQPNRYTIFQSKDKFYHVHTHYMYRPPHQYYIAGGMTVDVFPITNKRKLNKYLKEGRLWVDRDPPTWSNLKTNN